MLRRPLHSEAGSRTRRNRREQRQLQGPGPGESRVQKSYRGKDPDVQFRERSVHASRRSSRKKWTNSGQFSEARPQKNRSSTSLSLCQKMYLRKQVQISSSGARTSSSQVCHRETCRACSASPPGERTESQPPSTFSNNSLYRPDFSTPASLQNEICCCPITLVRPEKPIC